MISGKWKLEQIKKEQWILLLLVGILILTAVVPAENRKAVYDKDYETITKTEENEKDTMQEEWGNYEEKLEYILGQLDGAGQVKVMITKSASMETMVEKDQPYTIQMNQGKEEDGSKSQQENREETTVFEKDSQGNEKPYITKTLAPQIEGVLVLAQGGDNAVVARNITEAVMALFGIEAHKIKVMKME